MATLVRRVKRVDIAILAFVLGASLGVATPAGAEWMGPCLPGTTSPSCHFWRGKLKSVDDGDTIDVRMGTSTGKRKTVRVRLTGIQAMEQSVYTSHPSKRRGECHALQATARLEHLIAKGHGVLRLGAQDPKSTTGLRLRRSVAVKIGGRWHDLGRLLVAEGHALWLPNPVEYAWNATYNELAQKAAAKEVNLWDSEACGTGPSETSGLRLTVQPDARGNDFENVNGERVRVDNLDPLASVPLDGWWLRDSALRRYYFPPWAVIPPDGNVTLRVGSGTDTDTIFYWGLSDPVFENAKPDGRGMGDGAYLFDPDGDLRAWMMYPCRYACS
jgi:endonuclease YncB( thermonuclease family)